MASYLLAGGGTAGHVNPLLALADKIAAADGSAKIVALGTEEGLESRLVPERGYELFTIERLPFPRKLGGYALTFPFKMIRAIFQVRRFIRSQKIDVVVGFGGYASAPAYLAAKLCGTPVIVHEANALPGWANKLGSKFAAAVGVTFDNTPLPKSTKTGMPLRSEIEVLDIESAREMARVSFGLDPATTTILVTGGSLGAKAINETVEASRSLFDAAGIQVLHITGGASELPELKSGSYLRLKYCDRMDQALAAADLVISRAGASTVSEITALGLPALYIPYPVGNGEQKFNAKGAIDAGAALLVNDADFNLDYVAREVIPLVSSRRRLAQMGEMSKSIGIRNGASRLLALVEGVLRSKNR